MAVVIESEPQPWQTSDNPITYEFSSDMTGEPNFSFQVEIKVNSQVIYADKIFPEVGDRAHFDASTIVRYSVPGPTVAGVLSQDSGTTRTVQLVVTEFYGEPAVAEASNSSSVTDMFKARVSDAEFLVNDYDTDYKLQKWFTDHPTNDIEVLRDHDAVFSMLGGGDVASLVMEFYDSSDVNIHSYTPSSETHDIWQINVKTALLTATAGVPDVSLVAYFTLQINASEILTVRYLDDYCFNPTSVLWVNQYGGFDTQIFQHVHLEKGSISTFDYSRQFGSWNGSTFEYSLNNAGQTDYYKQNRQAGSVVTKYIDEAHQNWLARSIKGKGMNHRLYLTDGTTYPIKATSKAYELKQSRFVDLIAERLDFTVSFSDNSIIL